MLIHDGSCNLNKISWAIWLLLSNQLNLQLLQGWCPHDEIVKALDCGIIVSDTELKLCYYVHFWANTLGKGMNLLILPAMG